MSLRVELPDNVQCTVAITYDTDMAGGYSPNGVCHGRLASFLMDYMDMLCETAEEYGVSLQFFQIANGLEVKEVASYLRKIVNRGHAVDCHTYNHINLAHSLPEELDQDLNLANKLFERELGFRSTILRGPGGYKHGDLKIENQLVILRNGYKWVSGEFDYDLLKKEVSRRCGYEYMISAPSRNKPFMYPSGLIEIPIQGWTDRVWFDFYMLNDPQAYVEWRKKFGHKPVEKGWRCPWTKPEALNMWIRINLDCLNYAYNNGLLWVICWHPYSHYLHDPENKMLPAFLEAASRKAGRVWICTLRDVVDKILVIEEKD